MYPFGGDVIVLYQKKGNKLEVWKAKMYDILKPAGEEGDIVE
jgi:hypothetical protein